MAEDKYSIFVAPDKKHMGGITYTDPANHLKGPGSVKLYIYVMDLDKTIDVRPSSFFLLSRLFN